MNTQIHNLSGIHIRIRNLAAESKLHFRNQKLHLKAQAYLIKIILLSIILFVNLNVFSQNINLIGKTKDEITKILNVNSASNETRLDVMSVPGMMIPYTMYLGSEYDIWALYDINEKCFMYYLYSKIWNKRKIECNLNKICNKVNLNTWENDSIRIISSISKLGYACVFTITKK